MLKFLSIGSGSSGNCYFLQTASDAILIDAGVGIRNIKKFLYNYGIKLESVHHILITHDHADHIKSVGVISTEYNIPVYTSKAVHEGIMRNYCVPKKIPADNCKVIEVGHHYNIGDFSVTTFPVPHDSCGNIGYRIDIEGVTFCLMTDVGHVTEEMQQHISEANYLVLEANYDEEMLRTGPYPQHLKDRISSGSGHLSNRVCAETIANHATPALRHVWLCHLSEENNHPILAQKTVEQILASYGILPGKDFLIDVLKRKTPSQLYELT